MARVGFRLNDNLYLRIMRMKPSYMTKTEWFISLLMEGMEKIKEEELKKKIREEVLRELEAEGLINHKHHKRKKEMEFTGIVPAFSTFRFFPTISKKFTAIT